jgi:uncharacterized protein (TIGR02996 family)
MPPKKRTTPSEPPATPASDPRAALARAAAALPADPVAALAELVAAWRGHRAPAIAALVERAATLAAAGRPAITGTNHEELQHTWLSVEAEGAAADLPRLLATLTSGRCAGCQERLARLAARPADPLTLSALLAIITSDPSQRRGERWPVPFTSARNRKFWTALFALLDERADESALPALRAVAARRTLDEFQEWLAARIARSLPRLAARPAAPPSDLADAVAAVDAALARGERAGTAVRDVADRLFAAVWARPDDDEPRQVLADYLSERGDPRGEFIALQMARYRGELTNDGKRREKELLKRHKKEWLGPIKPLIQPYNLRFERGFLVTCQLEPNPEMEKTLGRHPAWSTIREYLIHGYSIARGQGKELSALLESHGAVKPPRFTRGIE